jgi:Uncharacterized conserved protein
VTVEIDGEYTTARVMGLEEDEVEQNVIDQIQTFVDAPAFQESVRVMPDTHVGAGCAIGFTMPLNERVVPNAIGVDIGCGMVAGEMGVIETDDKALAEYDEAIRDTVPTGRSVRSNPDYHIANGFPWESCEEKLAQFRETIGDPNWWDEPDWFDGYDIDYLKELCGRVEYDLNRVISSLGTLGGGNHFIELGQTDDERVWAVIHSGSRGIGFSIAEYWQENATERRTADWIRSELRDGLERYVVPSLDIDDGELVQWFQGGQGQSYIDSEAIKSAVTDNYLIGIIHELIREAHPQERPDNEALDYLEREEAVGYYIDMVFAQTYADESRRLMLREVCDAVDSLPGTVISSTHNFIDFDDGVMRKGACRSREDEWFVLPFNMADGTYLCRGTGASDWNHSAPHGAGRVMSRTQAFDELDLAQMKAEMTDVFSTSVVQETLDEAPQAYKSAELIANAIEGTATVEEHLDPVLSIKALE